MLPRAQTIAIALLVVVIGLVFWLVSDTGVSTGVFLPEDTLTPLPTIGPSPTPIPPFNAGNWSETAPGQLTYSSQAFPDASATAQYNTLALADLILQLGVEAPAEDARYPLLDILAQIRPQIEEQITSLGLYTEADGIEGPRLEQIGTLPLTSLRIKIPEQTDSNGQPYPGRDLILALVDREDGDVTMIQYTLMSASNPEIYGDFLAWVEAHAADLSGQPEPTAEATEEVEAEPTAEATEAVQAEATAEATEEAQAEPTAEATEEVQGEATAEAQAEPTAEATEEVQAEVTAEAQAEPTAAATEEVQAEATEEVQAIPTQEFQNGDKWMELAPGQLLYAADTNAMIVHMISTTNDVAAQIGAEPPAADSKTPLFDLLTYTRTSLEQQLETYGLTVADDAFEGPDTEEIDGVTVNYLSFHIEPQTGLDGQDVPGQQLFMALIDMGDDNVRLLQFQYRFADQADPAIYEDFQTWLADNAVTLATMPAES